ncbi:MAG: NlpC/P60 family protein [Nitrospira sp.]
MTLLNIKARKEGRSAVREVPHWSEPFWRVPFKDKGRDMKGADCYGWIRLIFERYQSHISLPPHDVIDPHDGPRVTEEIARHKNSQLWSPVSAADVRPFDLVIMRSFYRSQDGKMHTAEGHLGVMVDSQRVMHMEEDVGVLLGHLHEEATKSRIVGFWRHKEVKLPPK